MGLAAAPPKAADHPASQGRRDPRSRRPRLTSRSQAPAPRGARSRRLPAATSSEVIAGSSRAARSAHVSRQGGSPDPPRAAQLSPEGPCRCRRPSSPIGASHAHARARLQTFAAGARELLASSEPHRGHNEDSRWLTTGSSRTGLLAGTSTLRRTHSLTQTWPYRDYAALSPQHPGSRSTSGLVERRKTRAQGGYEKVHSLTRALPGWPSGRHRISRSCSSAVCAHAPSLRSR